MIRGLEECVSDGRSSSVKLFRKKAFLKVLEKFSGKCLQGSAIFVKLQS